MMNIFIGNLGTGITTTHLFKLFAQHGKVSSAVVIADDSGQSRGFGYVTMTDRIEAEKAIRTLNKKCFMQQFLVVSEAVSARSLFEKAV